MRIRLALGLESKTKLNSLLSVYKESGVAGEDGREGFREKPVEISGVV